MKLQQLPASDRSAANDSRVGTSIGNQKLDPACTLVAEQNRSSSEVCRHVTRRILQSISTGRSGAAVLTVLFSLGIGLSEVRAGQETDVEPKHLTFGVVPQQSASRLAKIWVPLLETVSKQLDQPIRFVTAKNIPTFERCLSAGAYDFAYMNPMHYVQFHDRPGYNALAHRAGKGLRGIIVARADSEISKIDQLGGTLLAFPSPAAFGASIIPRSELRSNGISFEAKYVSSHDSVYRSVEAGLMPAGGGVMRTFKTMPESIRSNLKIIYTTQPYTPHAIAAHNRVPAATSERFAEALINLAENSPDILTTLGIKGFEAAQDSAWDDVRGLKIQNSEIDDSEPTQVKCH